MAQEKRVVHDKYGFAVEVPVQRAETPEDNLARGLKNMWNTVLKPNPGLWFDIAQLPSEEVLKHRMLKSLIRECGIPEALRKRMWPIISGADQLKTSSRVVYSDIVTTLRSFKNSSSEQILRDLPRSFPGHPYFDSPEGTRALGNVLTAFSWLNPAIGYTQSMNFWAGLLLIMVSSEETVFWLVVTVIERILPAQYYDSTMLDIIVDNQVLFSLLEIYLPRVHQHLSTYTTDLSPILTQWFLCLFVNTLPTELTLRILDCFFFEGNKILLRVALGIFKCYEAEILKTESFEDLFLLIAKPIQIQNADDFMTLIFDRIWLRAFGREKLAVLRQNVKKVTMEEEEKKSALRRSRTAARLEAAAKEAIRAVEAEAAALEASSSAPSATSTATTSSPRSPASPRSPGAESAAIPIASSPSSSSNAPLSTTPTSAATIRADITGTSPSNRGGTSRFDPAKRQTIRISALPDDVKSVIDRRSWRAYKRSEEWHMIEEYFNSMEWAESNPVPPVSPTRPDSGSRTPLSVTDPESVPKASKTKLYKAHTVTSATTPHVPVIAAPKISAARAQASRSPTTASPTTPVSPKSPTALATPTTPSSSSNGNDPIEPKRRSYAEVTKSGIDASESSSSSSTGSPRGPPVQPFTQRKFVAATGGHGRSVSNASPMSPKKSTVSSTATPQHRFAAPVNAGAAPPPRANGANDRPPPNAERKWTARQGFNTLGKNISSLMSSLTKSAVTGNSTSPSNGTTEQKTSNGASTATSSGASKASPPWTSGSPPTTAGPVKTLPSGPSAPSVRLTRQPTLNQGAAAKLPTSPPTTPAPTPPPNASSTPSKSN